jgi:hypothetical protein
MWSAIVFVKLNTNEEFEKPREATVAVFDAERKTPITYTPGSLIDHDHSKINFYEIQNIAILSDVLMSKFC